MIYIRLTVVVLAVLGVLPQLRGQLTERAQLENFVRNAFKRIDTDKDGKLSAKEIESYAVLKNRLAEADSNGDGFLTLDEVLASLGKNLPKNMQDTQKENKPKVAEPEGPKPLAAAHVGVGKMIADYDFTDLKGNKAKLSDLTKSNGLVIFTTDTTCPLCKKYSPVIARFEKEYLKKGFGFLFINPTATDRKETITQFIESHGLTSPYVHDIGHELSAQLALRSTTEVLVLDAKRTLIYRGAIDDQYGLGYALEKPRTEYLRTVLNQIHSGGRVELAATEAPGCVLELKVQTDTVQAITYHNQISRLMNTHCVECHRTGGVGPFSLTTYKEVVARKAMIAKVVDTGRMPPWFATADAKASHSPWVNDRSIPAADKEMLLKWIKGNVPEGNISDAPKPLVFSKGWQISKPDAVFALPEAVEIKAEGVMPYVTLRTPTNFKEDRWISEMEIRPTAPEVVHHVLVFVVPPDSNGRPGRLRGGEAAGFFAAYVPGTNHWIYPDGFGKKIPKGSDVVFQMHYTPNGTAVKDQTEFGVVFAKENPRYELKVTGIANPLIRIPANAANHQEEAFLRLPMDAKVTALIPHMHVRGKAFRYELETEGGKKTTLLDIPRYDFNWQLLYRYAQPLDVKRGNTIIATAVYDNSSKNLANPDPNKLVRWGPQTFDEMLIGYVEYYVP
ncbi:MAG: redoxin family protein [Zavarzinella sp.]